MEKTQEFTCKYFRIGESFDDPQNSRPQVYAQVEAVLRRDQYEMEGQAQEAEASGSKKSLLLFLDNSGSMSGSYMRALKEGCTQLAELIFTDEKTSKFDGIQVVFYNSQAHVSAPETRSNFLNIIDSAKAGGLTNFQDCFELIEEQLEQAAFGEQVSIVFFTDGQDTCSRQPPMTLLTKLKDKMAKASQKFDICSQVFCIGFSEHHDAALLNSLAQAGSEVGNFVYIDLKDPGYKEKVTESLCDSLGMVMSGQSNPKLTLSSDASNFKKVSKCEVMHLFENEEAKQPDPQDFEFEIQQPSGSNNQADWTSVKAVASMILNEADVQHLKASM